MEKINEFIKKFTDKDIGKIIKINNKYYLVSREVEIFSKKTKQSPQNIGLFLGSEKNSKFKPSLALLYLLSKISNRKTILNKKKEWLFTNGKDLMTKGKTNFQEGLVLVQNKFDENIGLGEIQKRNLKNLIDIGDFLRREM